MTGLIGISLGDITGIGPEVSLKALAVLAPQERCRYLLIGDSAHVRRLNQNLGLNLPLEDYSPAAAKAGRYLLHNPNQSDLPSDLLPGDLAAADAAVTWLADGARRCLAGELSALVTAPVNKESIIRSGRQFVGQTEFLSEISNTSRSVMMLLGQDDRGRRLRVALVTTHLPLKRVAENITHEKVMLAIEQASQACHRLVLHRARIGVCGLNPHAGEGGQMGDEEIATIIPAVAASRQLGADVHGPLAADTLFFQAFRGDFDIVVAMYHDQGLAPLKMIGFESGVNWTLGLPFIRTSPDHGTAYEIAGQNKANPSSMVAAIALAKRLSRLQ